MTARVRRRVGRAGTCLVGICYSLRQLRLGGGLRALHFDFMLMPFFPFRTIQIDYSEKYQDGKFEYRHVILPKDHAKSIPKNRTLSEAEWRGLGVQQSLGWEHYACHRTEPHILLFIRPLGTVSPLWRSISFSRSDMWCVFKKRDRFLSTNIHFKHSIH